jgi:hypothetical protein
VLFFYSKAHFSGKTRQKSETIKQSQRSASFATGSFLVHLLQVFMCFFVLKNIVFYSIVFCLPVFLLLKNVSI